MPDYVQWIPNSMESCFGSLFGRQAPDKVGEIWGLVRSVVVGMKLEVNEREQRVNNNRNPSPHSVTGTLIEMLTNTASLCLVLLSSDMIEN